MKRILYLIPIAIIMVGIAGCLKKIDPNKIAKTTWNPSIAAPIINTKLDVYDILAQTDTSDLITIDNQGLLALVYEGELFSFAAADIIQLPDTGFSESIDLSAQEETQLVGSGSVTVSHTETISYTSTGAFLDSIQLKSGQLNIVLNPDVSYTGSATIVMSLPDLHRNGQPFTKTINLNTLSNNLTVDYDIAGYTFELSDGGTTTNNIPVHFDLTLNYTGGSVGTTDKIDFEMNISQLAFKGIYGDIGQQIVSTDKDSILLRIFQSTEEGYFHVFEPKLRVDIDNSFGFTAQVDFNVLESITYNGGVETTTPIVYNGQSSPIINFATINGPSINEVGEHELTSIVVNESNSNIEFLSEPTPKYLHHEVTITSNPSGAVGNNFILDESEIKVNTQVEFPLIGYAHSWKLQDTIDFEFGEDLFSNIDQILFRTSIENFLPVDASVQLYFLDENLNVLDSLIDSGDLHVFESGVTNSDGRVIEATTKITDVTVNEERALNITQAKKVIVRATAETKNADSQNSSNSEVIRVYDDSYIIVKLGVKVDGNVNLTGN